MVSKQRSTEGSNALYASVFVHSFAHASIFMTEDHEMQDDFSTAFFLRLQYRALSLCFLRQLFNRFYLHDWRRELKDGFDTIFFCKAW